MSVMARFLGAFAKLQKTTNSFVTSVRPFVRMEQFSCFHRTDSYEVSYFSILSRFVGNIQVSLKSGKNNGYFTVRPTYTYDLISLISS
jgi:hypothetical protein